MTFLIRLHSLGLAASIALGIVAVPVFAAPAQAQIRGNCASNANLWHVHRRLLGAIEQLNHDQRDYGGHRDAALTDLQNARMQLVAAEQYAVQSYGANPTCFQANGSLGNSDAAWGQRQQNGSNYSLSSVTNSIERLISMLDGDQHDYGGHRIGALNQMQAARAQLMQAEQYAEAHGH